MPMSVSRQLRVRRGIPGTTPTGSGTVLWDGSLNAIPAGTTFTGTGSTIFLSKPWPYSSLQNAGNDATHTASLTVVTGKSRNARETNTMKIVMQPGAQRMQPSSREDTVYPFIGKWTPDGIGSVDLWYGWSMWYDVDWGDVNTLINENTGTYWHTPMAFRMNPAVIANGSMNISGDNTNANGSAGTPITSTPRTFYLRRNSVQDAADYYTDGYGLDKISMGLVETGKWMDFVVHVRWSTTTTNALRECWRDGVFMGSSVTANAIDIAPTTTHMSDYHAFRMGLYQETNLNHTRTAWYSNCRIGTSYAAVDPASVT